MSDHDLEEDATVTYTVKELLSGINVSLISINTKLDSKADKVDVQGLESRIVSLERLRWLLGGCIVGIGINGALNIAQVFNLIGK